MLIRPSKLDPVDADSNPESSQSSPHQSIQHGLLHIPTESLNHITSFLDPPSLLILGQVNKHLYDHVQNDVTWQSAFFCQLLGVAPEGHFSETSTLLLRRTESTWRNEFISRFVVKRCWERSPTTTITHNPHDSPIAGMHLMAENGLLTSSLQYGIVSRSLPLTGKVLRGFLDASGDGLGVGNPNQEFTPNISACTLASDGGTGLVMWGFRTGQVSIVTAGRAMERRGRASVSAIQCTDAEKHEGAVLDAVWGRNSRMKGMKSMYAVLTAGADGRVKLWYSRRVNCLWSSQVPSDSSIPDPCVKVAAELDRGVAVAAMKSGTIMLWTGLHAYLPYGPPNKGPPPPVDEIYIHRLFAVPEDEKSPDALTHAPMALHVHCCCTNHTYRINILVAYENHPYFYRVRVDPVSRAVEVCTFGNAALTFISAILPCFADRTCDHSFIFAGDSLGFVSVYDWCASPPDKSAQGATLAAVRTFAAYTDGSGVSSMAWNGSALATGSTRGVVCIWDALTFAPLLVFAAPGLGPRVRARVREGEGVGRASVSQILLVSESDMLVAAIGSRVMAWKLGRPWHGKGKKVRETKLRKWERTSATRYQQQQELHEEITQLRLELEQEEQEHIRPSYGTQIEQRKQLAALGLNEVEAVEYILMVSRDEEELRRSRMTTLPNEEIFSVDSDDFSPSIEVDGSWETQPLSRSRHSSSGSQKRSQIADYSIHHTLGTTLNRKVQMSPRFMPEPMEAGSMSPSATPFSIGGATPVRTDDETHFPAVSAYKTIEQGDRENKSDGDEATDASKSTSPSTSPDVSKGSMSSSLSVSGSGSSAKSAWNTPLGTASRSAGTGTTSFGVTGIAHDTERSNKEGVGEANRSFDDELSMAIELSLVEARNRGEIV